MFERVRGPWLQVGGLVTALAFVGGVATLGGRGSAATRASSVPAATPAAAVATAVETATADPREAAVSAAAKNYVEAVSRAYRSGKADELHSLCSPGSRADSMASDPEDYVRGAHATFLTTSSAFDEIQVTTGSSTARASITYVLTGHRATWPELVRVNDDRNLAPVTMTIDFSLQGAAWLVDAVH